jgi:hypothetical protein
MSMKNSNDTITSCTRDFPASSVLPQPTLPPHAPKEHKEGKKEKKTVIIGQHICYMVYQINPAFCDAVSLLLSTKELICFISTFLHLYAT